MNERTSRFLNFMAWAYRDGKDGIDLLLTEDYYEIGKVVKLTEKTL